VRGTLAARVPLACDSACQASVGHLWPRAAARLRVICPQAQRSADRGRPGPWPRCLRVATCCRPISEAAARMVSGGSGVSQWGQFMAGAILAS